MGFVKSGTAILLVAGAAAAYMFPQPGQRAQVLAAPAASDGTYALFRAGQPTGCTLRRGPAAGNTQTELVMDGCQDSLGDYADLRFWRDQVDGSVEFVSTDGSVLLQFAAGDGAAYEAFGAGVPLFSLSEGEY